jgi:biotin synthase-related radical SAM superfamily protein
MTRTEQARETVLRDYLCDCEATAQYQHSTAIYKQAGVDAVSALIAAVRADTLELVEQEAQSRAVDDAMRGSSDPKLARYRALTELADFCRQQREGK